ncbi:hypothetical protein [Streptomyces sp. HGB0020]|uniref:hypothetical protein n=1 Tax=Streptomyces sp. HGB0020 TaxID=1078086 RepID=UPI00034E358F|nr:hypothetical protein HMPREF1211_01518 [Streptomyces sp. HGB0020]
MLKVLTPAVLRDVFGVRATTERHPDGVIRVVYGARPLADDATADADTTVDGDGTADGDSRADGDGTVGADSTADGDGTDADSTAAGDGAAGADTTPDGDGRPAEGAVR